MATSKVFIWLTLCTCVVFASPTRRQINTETTSSDPVIVVTDDGESWDDSDDDFDLEGGGWMKEISASPSSIPESPDYEDYDDEVEDIQPADKDENSNNSEFLFLQPTDTRLMLEDDDDNQPGVIKVRHTSKNTLTDSKEDGNVLQTIDKSKSGDQFVFTIDGDDDDDDFDSNKIDSSKDEDFVLEDSVEEEPKKTSKKEDNSSRREDEDDEEGDDDDDLTDNEDESIFDSPEEEAQVIYGDHVFLY